MANPHLSYVIDHVFLPPKLPQKDDYTFENSKGLIKTCLRALKKFQSFLAPEVHPKWTTLVAMLQGMLDMRDIAGKLLSGNISDKLEKMAVGDVISIHITAQNAGLVIRRLDGYYSFEFFELSPRSQDVMTTEGRLIQCFPGPAVAIKPDRIADPEFRQALSDCLVGLDNETPAESLPFAYKAGQKHTEIRDTVHPGFATGMLVSFLRGVGESSDVTCIYKRTRDDVLWDQALIPWRRSALWLLIRVSLQTTAQEGNAKLDKHDDYKSFMVFLMADILHNGWKTCLPSDILFVMKAKISQRLIKLSHIGQPLWLKHVEEQLLTVESSMADKWTSLETQSVSKSAQENWRSSMGDLLDDTTLRLNTLGPYYRTICSRDSSPDTRSSFTIKPANRLTYTANGLPISPTFRDEENTRPQLFELESWIRADLPKWTIDNMDSDYTCGCLEMLIDGYWSCASQAYCDCPADISRMLLMLMGLWIALDRSATKKCPLLLEYQPGFSRMLFAPLLLPKRDDIDELERVERYLQTRRLNAKYSCNSAFTFDGKKSFSVRYFDHSSHHQHLQERIIAKAKSDKEAKEAEFARMHGEYRKLCHKAVEMDCDYIQPEYEWNEPTHSRYCQKCILKARAERMDIGIHEWPVPEDTDMVKCVVFNLEVPRYISSWLDTTFTLLVDLFSPAEVSTNLEEIYPLSEYRGLSHFMTSTTRRLQPASSVKPVSASHYSASKKLSQCNSSTDVCVRNGMRYEVFETKHKATASSLLYGGDIKSTCTLQLPQGSYEKLQYAVDGTDHSSNIAIADQGSCSAALSFDEMYSFCTLRSGHRLQWRNILRELISRVLNFNSKETNLLILAAIWHVGPHAVQNTPFCESHADLEEEDYGLELVDSLRYAVGTIEGNWQNTVALQTFVAITSRVLSSSPIDQVRAECIELLRRARGVAENWMHEINVKVQQAQEEKAAELCSVVLEVALTCHRTFDVDYDYFGDLIKTSDDIMSIIKCYTTIRDRYLNFDSLSNSTKFLVRQFWGLASRLESFLSAKILDDQDGIHLAIGSLWSEYSRGDPFVIGKEGAQWLTSKTSCDENYSTFSVHYNVLSGELLIDGSPLATLPREYESHDLYIRLFPKKKFDVVPSRMAGMKFATRHEFFGYQIHFGMKENQLIIRAVKDRTVYEILPETAVNGDFPEEFVKKYVQWLHIGKDIIEWRPINKIWESSPQNWALHSTHYSPILVKGQWRLVEMGSKTGQAVVTLLAPLERPTHVHMMMDTGTRELRIHLPRLKLDFFMGCQSEHLESKQFRGMIIDTDQSFGTLTGLVNKLVLRGKQGNSRCVIIPHGEVKYMRTGDHVSVTIHNSKFSTVQYHKYQIDTRLRRLVDNGSIRSKLFRCYLHALTSGCLVDSLTLTTGTEEAIQILRSASTQSLVNLTTQDTEILSHIAKLTPGRQFYPPHLMVMQQVRWKPLSPLSQHNSFLGLAERLFKSHETFSMIQNGPASIPSRPSIKGNNQKLLDRDTYRNSVYRVDYFGAEASKGADAPYNARDRSTDLERVQRSYTTAKLVDEWSVHLKACNLLNQLESWGTQIRGLGLHPSHSLDLGYGKQWLDPLSDFMPQMFLQIYDQFSKSTPEKDKYRIMFFLGTLSYSNNADEGFVQSLLALATVPELRSISRPVYDHFTLGDGYAPKKGKLVDIAQRHSFAFYESPESKLGAKIYESRGTTHQRLMSMYQKMKNERAAKFAEALFSQGLVKQLSKPRPEICTFIQADQAMANAQAISSSWYRNSELRQFLGPVQEILDKMSPKVYPQPDFSILYPRDDYQHKSTYLSLQDAFSKQDLAIKTKTCELRGLLLAQKHDRAGHGQVKTLLDGMSSSAAYEKEYLDDLKSSLEALRESGNNYRVSENDHLAELRKRLDKCQRWADKCFESIRNKLQSQDCLPKQLAVRLGLSPRLSPTLILQHLSHNKVGNLTTKCKDSLIHYGIVISVLQRAERIFKCYNTGGDILPELLNTGHQGWDPLTYPDWLLFEIENNLLIRPVQADIATEMMTPSTKGNSIMQLNMGEGKSSIIVPIIAAALANKNQLVRVVVLRPLANQMFNSLVKKLGGMLDRRVYQIPISRSVRLDMELAQKIQDLYRECMANGGILLVQPEHILSFELLGLDKLLSGEIELGNTLIKTQRWLDHHSRDILDESDEVLSVDFELIYTMGTQQAIEFSPTRWIIIQAVLELANKFSKDVSKLFPQGLESVPVSKGSTNSRIRVLEREAGQKLVEMIANSICQGGLGEVPVLNLSETDRSLLFKFLTNPSIATDSTSLQPLKDLLFTTTSTRRDLLVLWGLLGGGVLMFALSQKRWRVNFGLDLSRTMLAVPYRAKDSPAPRAEFSHPDATIVLTCLSYYYEGLSDAQLKTAFDKLFLGDNSQAEYDVWIRKALTLPKIFHKVTGVNLQDLQQCTQELYPHLRYSKGAIDYYLCQVVFPKEMKEFPDKLSSSGWNIGREKARPMTGFSGTNDSQYLLPLSVHQCSLADQIHTNAKQLLCVLKPENKFHPTGKGSKWENFDAKTLLDMVIKAEPQIQVILDVGAQVLELQNEQLARRWLEKDTSTSVEAVIYFHDNELYVLTRDGHKETFVVSPYAMQTEKCLVYLDEVHTRGTDLSLPDHYRAAVTLGPNLTKDRLVQACMRMRKLEKGQSLLFCAPADIQRQILQRSGKRACRDIEISDVLEWCISETWTHTRKCAPLWVTQGLRYLRHSIAWSNASNADSEGFPVDMARRILEKEAQTIEERYGIDKSISEEQVILGGKEDMSLAPRETQVDAIRAKCRYFDTKSFNSAALQEEQERELSPEMEREQQVEPPPSLEPAQHSLHANVRQFLSSGEIPQSSAGFCPAFQILNQTAAEKHFDQAAWGKELLVTADFARTVVTQSQDLLDSYIRPVHWIASGKKGKAFRFVILSPFEANEAMAFIQNGNGATLHIYAPRVGLTMRPMDDLSCGSLPHSPGFPPGIRTLQLNLFAGQLYLKDYAEYVSLCQFLGLVHCPPGGNVRVTADGFVTPSDRADFDPVMEATSKFTKSPVELLRALMALRRKGQSISRSHIGAILNGGLLTEETQFE
ncbi:hypothetical protein FQN51_001032 [Onygenales sp. PD_10]|nr:hypothetical protein FQN51_001032 [Onygenales sp. PD_10]